MMLKCYISISISTIIELIFMIQDDLIDIKMKYIHSRSKLQNVIMNRNRSEKQSQTSDLKSVKQKKINKSEHSSDADFPKTLVLQYSKQRGQTYLLCSDGNRSGPAAVAAILLLMNEAKVQIQISASGACYL